MKFADKSDGAGPRVKASCLSEGKGTGIMPLSSGEKENTGNSVKFMKTRMRKTIKIIMDPLYTKDSAPPKLLELGRYPAGIRLVANPGAATTAAGALGAAIGAALGAAAGAAPAAIGICDALAYILPLTFILGAGHVKRT
jgi:hypothetical protein